MNRAWILPALLAICGTTAATGLLTRENPVAAIAFALLFAVLAVINSPLIFPTSTTEAAARSADDGRPIVYWRPGCKYCARLRIRLGPDAHRVHWVNIWADPEAAATVRTANDGNETVPTVFIADHPYVNPEPAWLKAQLADQDQQTRT
ncbi:glutaredoxin domain-containing protein [Streptomyces acidiscabies]|uniref:glutaredoxin domain-containing protein n=1 Tax=Streptomyces acidiscabies TaxID=42234 RepID=UPI0009595B0C|nr:glutaredoxin domain-containing protein [Streptomyces acidiscabies]GAV44194.1 glutaredoxin [Streptomyces acidiscabies]